MIHHLYRIVVLLAALLLWIQCENDKGFAEASYPRIITLPVTNVGPSGASFHAKTAQAGTDEVVNRGFVWGLDAGVTALNGEKVDVGPGSGDFDAIVSFGLVKGETYFVKAFAATKSMLAYGPVVEFVSDGSLPPDITSFSPTTASWRDTVTILGTGFSYIEGNNVVTFGDAQASVLKSTETSIQCAVPTGTISDAVRINVKVGSGVAQSVDYFKLLSPTIDNISPAEGTFGDVITVTGSRFGASLHDNVVKFDTYDAELVTASPNKLVVKVPASIRTRESVISVTTGGITTTASSSFVILAPDITNLSVTKAKTGALLTINGRNFNAQSGGTTVTIGGNPATVQSVSSVSVTVTIPPGPYPARSVFPEVNVAEQNAASAQALELQDPWFRKAESPGNAYGRSQGVAFAMNSSAYVGLGVDNSDQFWRYVPASDKWTEVASFPGGARSHAVSFVIGSFAYVGLGSTGETDFWRFDPAANQWTRVADFPSSSSKSVALAANGKGYVAITAESDNFWEYNPATDSWAKKVDYPGLTSSYTSPSTGFVIDNTPYFFSSDNDTAPKEGYRYNALSNVWATIAAPDHNAIRVGETGYSVNGNGYIRTVSELLRYNPATNSWKVDSDLLGYRRFSLAVEINSKVYFGCGDYRYDWWEYDPTLE